MLTKSLLDLLILAFSYLVLRCFLIGRSARQNDFSFGSLISYGVGVLIALHVFINIGVAGGHKALHSLGDVFLINKINDKNTNNSYFPDILYKHSSKEIEITTVQKEITNGGEDFELVLCLPPNCGQELVKRIGVGAAIVGTTTNNTDILLIDSQGIYPNEQLTLSQGFQHF